MEMKRAKSILPALLVAVAACSEPIADTETPSVLSLRSGTSFGMCAGYCVTELIIEDDAVRFTESAWPFANLPPKSRTLPLSSAEREQILRLVDVGELEHLEGVHGCPDCADGGAEWIELQTPTDTIRVTFEYGRELAPIAELQAEIRALRGRFPRS
jgi:hypothetical protein